MNATSLQTPAYAESSRAIVLDENNWTLWGLSPSPNSPSLNYSGSGLLLAGTFPASTEPSAFSISRPLAVNLTAYPIMYMLIKVTTDVSYGIRFYSKSSGSVVPIWTDTDALNHRQGTGKPEHVQVAMLQLIELNTGRIFDTVNRVSLYVERGVSSQAASFSLQIARFEFLNYPITPALHIGSYHAIYVGLNQIQPNPSLELKSVQIEGKLNASIGAVVVPYFVRGLTPYPGTVFNVTKAPLDVSTTLSIRGQVGRLFSDNLPTESAALVFVAAGGVLTRFITVNISLNYYARSAQASSVPPPNRSVYVDYAFFLLLLPTSIIVLTYGQIRKPKSAKLKP